MIGAILLALAPIALLIALGHLMHRRLFLPDSFWPQAERLCYYVLLPALFIHALSMADLRGVPVGALAIALVIPIIVVSALLVLAKPWLASSDAAFTSVFQGGIRFNNYVGLSAAVSLLGAPALSLAAVANAAIVPTVNLLCVLVFARWGVAQPSLRGVLRGLALNPLLMSCLIGIAIQAAGLGLPPGIEGFLKALGQASLPLGLLCVGAALDWGALGRGLRPALAASFAKFVLMPLVTFLVLKAFGLGGQAALIAILFHALPTASSSYVMARQLGGDAPLMAGICALQTVLAALTVPVALLLLAPAL
ncbi:MAG: AEC family transporter [Bosea sp.]|uniref:AEC family transporter n=1 Tax=Bosea sp. (in: a-proteobacteria) TaxID=1871050 RepID=UPI001AD530F2|nr:AEC family transporter [Bosea sp. (in: a-proteobacteria)]MBN9471160.1 AEC family transporter [Bosea sp. (in: a-proteobacteria)]